MGHLIYAGEDYEFDDRLLAHVKIAMGSKLRRNESFFLTWKADPASGSGRFSLWVSPAIPLAFRFSGSRPPELNQVWLEIMAEQSHTPGGLVVISEAEAMQIHQRRSQIPVPDHHDLPPLNPVPSAASKDD
ncbi:hypothetical protein [Jonesia quinghaiensis]|uniref:DUF7882 family protein n=1 Tax=Jonesia quinghaiensis TaxID=262806 RepID=UPI000491A0DE|nr:hypothetical protein [Jonesia quinghaiensis]